MLQSVCNFINKFPFGFGYIKMSQNKNKIIFVLCGVDT